MAYVVHIIVGWEATAASYPNHAIGLYRHVSALRSWCRSCMWKFFTIDHKHTKNEAVSFLNFVDNFIDSSTATALLSLLGLSGR